MSPLGSNGFKMAETFWRIWRKGKSGTSAEVVYHTLASNGLDKIESCAATVEVRALEWPDLQELRLVRDKLETLRKELTVKVSRPATAFPKANARNGVSSWAAQIVSCTSLLSSISLRLLILSQPNLTTVFVCLGPE